MAYTMGSLFAGIGGFDLGFERAGFETVWQVEINDWCRKVLAKNFPKAERYADIRECGAHNLKRVDVLCGGFPCQDISIAGKQAGITDDSRSGLWSHYARIISELRPRFVLVENVAALLSNGMGRVLGDLAEIGYDAEWEVISAADVGAPHLRERVWILAYPHSELHGCDDGRSDTEGSELRHEPFSVFKGLDTEVADTERLWELQQKGSKQDERRRPSNSSDAVADTSKQQWDRWMQWTCGWEREPQEALRDARRDGRQEAWMSIPESLLGRVANGLPSRVDRLRGLGNAVVPQIPELYARKIRQHLEAV